LNFCAKTNSKVEKRSTLALSRFLAGDREKMANEILPLSAFGNDNHETDPVRAFEPLDLTSPV
jgi:hypothetical protein